MNNRVSSRVKCRYRTWYSQIILYFFFQFIHRLISEWNNQNLCRINSFFVHKILYLCSYRCCLSRSGAGNNKTIILIRKYYFSLILIQYNYRVYCLKNIIQIFFFLDHCSGKKFLIVVFNICFCIIVIVNRLYNVLFFHTINIAEIPKHTAIW